MHGIISANRHATYRNNRHNRSSLTFEVNSWLYIEPFERNLTLNTALYLEKVSITVDMTIEKRYSKYYPMALYRYNFTMQ